MQIIDAHYHIFDQIPQKAPTEKLRQLEEDNPVRDLLDRFADGTLTHGVVMGNHSLDPARHRYPDGMHYCVGLDFALMRRTEPQRVYDLVEQNLRLPQCCGVKLYPGYFEVYLSDPVYGPIYELAQRYGKPVAAHMGQTAMPGAKLKYSHPLTLDEVAADHPRVQFVMCHFGNPFLSDAAAVMEKNSNVAADLSGLLDGRVELDRYFAEQAGYVSMLRSWITYVNDYDRFMFGTDWPAVEHRNYIDFIRRLLPEAHWDKVFFHNANRIYQLGLRPE